MNCTKLPEAHFLEVNTVLSKIDTLEALKPFEFKVSDIWVLHDESDDIIGIALVEPDSSFSSPDTAYVHRIGVLDERQGEGFGRELLEYIHNEYGPLELEIRDSKEANGFYKHLGMELTEEKPASFEDGEGLMNVWRYE